MITKDNLPDLLQLIGFAHKGKVFSKRIGLAELKVDFGKELISYPETQGLKINERQTCSFSANENFVVLECVHRLLEKGYKPEHIELEPKWKLGHGASGGRADILIRDNHARPLLLIECKTAGREFDGAWNATLRDGSQLFSYAQQISETQFLCLYASEFDKGAVNYTSQVVAHRDNPKYLAENPTFRGFKDATDVKDRYAIWRDTYKLDSRTQGIFEDNIQPYRIGKDKYSLADLKPIPSVDQQKKYHQFATILRQHNVSGRENAFDKLINLFLCKLVDETRNPNDLKFYWKGVAYDTHFDLLDRLQQLYQAGMKEFLGEDITYIDRSAVMNAMRFIKQNPDATQNAVWNLFVQQKFFTNNDFSFIDVHNERLFYQNAEVLLGILQMWQDIRLTGDHQNNQFLGDLFEGFLDRGVKQSEGQFFTPAPICRFILMSLPLPTMLAQSAQPPRAIDYACGAGHFLTELASQQRALLPGDTDLAEYHKAIYGIEKEYRLSKVAKVSAFMYGQKDINICYGDGLVNQHAAFSGIQDGSFDLLIANPPYSVRGFLETLPEAERSAYALTEAVSDAETANSIETFFVERAKQLLKAGGVAAIIVPASLLSNVGGVYVRAREILLQHFDIVAIAEFGSGTFGKTGTNTVTLFLRRKQTAPETAQHYQQRVDEWFGGDDNQPVYKDEHLIDAYAAHVGIAAADYKTLLQGRPNAVLLGQAMFAQYRKAFDSSSEVAALKKSKSFKTKAAKAQQTELARRFLKYAQAIERDKLYHFVLAADQPNPVLLIRSPTETKAIKKFLGYGWSDAKGNEGIQPIRDTAGHLITTLYDETNRDNADKLNVLIAHNFDGKPVQISSALADCAGTARLVDLLDFSRVDFEKQVSTSLKSSLVFTSQWPLVALESIASLNPSKKELKNIAASRLVSFVEMASVSERGTIERTEERKLSELLKSSYTYFADNDIILAKITPCMENGKCALARNLKNGIALGSSEFHVIRTDKSKALPAYVFAFLNREMIRNAAEKEMTGAVGHRRVPETFYAKLKLPLPALGVQVKIIAECGAVDAEVDAARNAIATANAGIAAKVEAIYHSAAPRQPMESLALAVQYGLNEKMNEDGNGYRIFRMNEIVRGRMTDGGSMKRADISAEEFAKYRLNRGDLLFNRTNSIEHVGKTGLFDLAGDYCFASYLVRIVPDTKQVLPLFLTCMMNSATFQAEAKAGASKAINQANINATKMKNLKVPAPTLAVQKKFVAEVEALEQRITAAEAVIAAAPARKQAVLDKYL